MSSWSINPTVLFGIIGVILLTSFALTMLLGELQRRRLDLRIGRALVAGSSGRTPLAGLLSLARRLGEWLRGFYAVDNIEHLRDMVRASGFNPHKTLPLLLAVKLLVSVGIGLAAIVAASLAGSFMKGFFVICVGGILAVIGPEQILTLVRRRFVTQLDRGTPDALDLLIVCNEAGMGLESALDRVSKETLNSSPAVASVLTSFLDDLRVLPDRSDALTNLGKRSGSDGLRRFATMLNQSFKYGTPLSQALRAVAEELRRDRMNKLEESAVKLPAKLIFPLILFIMPSLYIILLGPSFMQLHDTLTTVIQTAH
ncbi:MAG TPA: type II secretion system F family protein [Acetobacteraceae bacterium]|nr:type II secretion system F family protein [Acetobacteraceae bacterium]